MRVAMRYLIKEEILFFLFRKCHCKYAYLRLRKNKKAETVNCISDLDDLDEEFNPYMICGLINGRELKLVRD